MPQRLARVGQRAAKDCQVERARGPCCDSIGYAESGKLALRPEKQNSGERYALGTQLRTHIARAPRLQVCFFVYLAFTIETLGS